MDSFFSMGGLIPLWILGAPLVAGLIAMAAAPKHSSRTDQRDMRDGRAALTRSQQGG